jgi:hypothetical protein
MTYTLCGLKVASEFPLPDLLPWTGDGRPADIEIGLGDVPDRLDDPAYVGPLLQTARDGTCRYVIADVAAFLVEAGRRVTVRPWMAPDAPAVRAFLLGSVFGFLCHQRGLLPLHAGCVELAGKAVAFTGHSGVGKSTLTATFLRRGLPILADDVTVIDVSAPGGAVVLPSFPRIKLWRDVVDQMGLAPDGLERVRPELEKYMLPVEASFRREPLPLGSVYHLKTVSDPLHAGLEPLRGSAAMGALVEGVYRRLSAFRMGRREAVMAALMRLAAVPGLQLSRIQDLGQLEATAAMIAARQLAPESGAR